MRKLLLTIAMLLSFGVSAVVISDSDNRRARDLVSKMTLDEKIALISGKTDFSTMDYPRLGIPEVLMADGPQGVRNQSPHSTLYPCGIMAAATWDRGLAYRFGASLADDARARGIGFMLGPGVNIYRTPLCGRNFEYYGEDPYLASETAVGYIKGMQDNGVIATVKHFAANNEEWDRHHVSSDVDERTLNEIYFPTFRKAVQQANVGAVMNSYNLLNGVHATENGWLNKDVLRDKWGFKGILMSDWNSVYSTVNAFNNGLDLEMPSNRFFNHEAVKVALKTGLISEKELDRKCERILGVLSAFGKLDKPHKDESIPLDYAKSHATALDIARGGIVLLNNLENILPLKGKTLIIGPNADRAVCGGGSGFVSPYNYVTPAEGLKTIRKNTVVYDYLKLYPELDLNICTDESLKTPGYVMRLYPKVRAGGEMIEERAVPSVNMAEDKLVAEGVPQGKVSAKWTGYFRPEQDMRIYFDLEGDGGYSLFVDGREISTDKGSNGKKRRVASFDADKNSVHKIEVLWNKNNKATVMSMIPRSALRRNGEFENIAGKVDNIVYVGGFDSTTEYEGADRTFAMPDDQGILINYIASINPNLVAVINSGGNVDMSDWFGSAKAVVMAWYPGEEGGRALAEVLTGKISPSGKLPISLERNLVDNPCYASYHKAAKGKTIGRSRDTECVHIPYNEGIFQGYRGYDLKDPKSKGKSVRFPFGFGLSYTSFAFDNLKVRKLGDNRVAVTFDLTNTGKREGAEVAQVYVSDPVCSVPRPKKELKGYEKVSLRPGETKTVEIVLEPEAFQFYDLGTHDFVIEPGEFIISVGNSSINRPLKTSVTL